MKIKKYRAYRPNAPEDVQKMVYFTLENAETYVNNKIWGLEVDEFAGFQDQKHKDIYEEDIIFNHSISVEKSGVVKFSNIHHAYIIEYPKTHQDNWEFMHGSEHNFEVVGNTRENPELIP